MWNWQIWQDKPYLTCDLLSQPHGFFTSAFHPFDGGHLTGALHPEARSFFNKQVHGCALVAPGKPDDLPRSEEGLPEADGLLSTDSAQALWVKTADCTPVLIEDATTGQVAALHAGWRSTALEIVPQAIRALVTQGSQLADLRVALGPAIAGEVYQVGQEVALQVGRTVTPPSLPDDQVLEQLLMEPEPALLSDDKPNHLRLDGRKIILRQLGLLGLRPEQVAVAPHCTYQEPERFFSFRRTGLKQNQWSGIVSR